MPGFDFGTTPNRQTALELVYGAFEDLQEAYKDVKYGELHWRDVLPEQSLNTGINPGATSMSYRVRDWKGRAQWRGRHDGGVPTVGRTIDKILVPIEVGGVSAIFDREDARQVQFGYSENLLTDLPRYMRMACEYHFEGTFFYGDSSVGFSGWLDYPNVPTSTVPNGAGGTATWATKTSDEIQFDVNNAIATVWDNSKFVHLPDTVFLPGAQFALISSLRMSDASDKSVMEYLTTNNIYTARTGRPLKFVPIRYLDQAGAGGTDRMVVAQVDRDNYEVPFPLPFELLEPQEHGFDVNLYSEYKFGSLHLPYPLHMSYSDGI